MSECVEEAICAFTSAIAYGRAEEPSFFGRALAYFRYVRFFFFLICFSRDPTIDALNTMKPLKTQRWLLPSLAASMQTSARCSPPPASKRIELQRHSSGCVVMMMMSFFWREIQRLQATKTLEFAPHNAVAVRTRGKCYKLMGRMEMAHKDLQRALKLEPNDEYMFPFTYVMNDVLGFIVSTRQVLFVGESAAVPRRRQR